MEWSKGEILKSLVKIFWKMLLPIICILKHNAHIEYIQLDGRFESRLFCWFTNKSSAVRRINRICNVPHLLMTLTFIVINKSSKCYDYAILKSPFFSIKIWISLFTVYNVYMLYSKFQNDCKAMQKDFVNNYDKN